MKNKSIASRSFSQKFYIYTGEKLKWWQVIFRLKGSVLSGTFPWIGLCTGYGFLISFLYHWEILSNQSSFFGFPKIVVTLNIVLSLLLGLRTSTAYQKFWEGRTLWGAMINNTRNLARSIWVQIEESDSIEIDKKKEALRWVSAFAVAMKLHLRREKINSELSFLLSSKQCQRLQNVNHAPLEIAFWIEDYLQQQHHKENANIFQLTAMQNHLDTMVDILGGCERILKTPMPLIYTITLKKLLIAYFIVMPVGLVADITWYTGPVMGLLALLILSVNEIGSEIEEPFGRDPNDLPLDVICKTIVNNIEDLLAVEPTRSISQKSQKVYNLAQKIA